MLSIVRSVHHTHTHTQTAIARLRDSLFFLSNPPSMSQETNSALLLLNLATNLPQAAPYRCDTTEHRFYRPL